MAAGSKQPLDTFVGSSARQCGHAVWVVELVLDEVVDKRPVRIRTAGSGSLYIFMTRQDYYQWGQSSRKCISIELFKDRRLDPISAHAC